MAQPRSVKQRAAGLLLLPLLLFTAAISQPLPSLELDSTSYEVGDEVTLEASSLTPDEEFQLTIVEPDGEAVEETLTADSEGRLAYTFQVREAGEWSLRLQGTDLNASISVEVVGEGTAEGEERADAQENRVDAQAEERPGGDEAQAGGQAAGRSTDEALRSDAEAEAQAAGQDAGDDGRSQPGEQVEPEGEAQAPASELQEELKVAVDGDAVVATRGDERVWRFDFPDGSGGTGAVLEAGQGVWVGHGNSLILLDRETGIAQLRYPMPGRVIRIEPIGGAISVVSDVGGSLRQRIEVDGQGPRSTVRFGVDLDTFDWLRNEADVPDPEARLQVDPTNPWLLLQVGIETDDRQLLREAVERGRTFYDLAGLARELYETGEVELASEAMDRALEDFADRGYDPELLTDADLHYAYDFPLAPMEEALDSGDLEAARFWAPWLNLVSSENAPRTTSALQAYARQLAAVGQRDAASLWRERATPAGSASPAASLDRFFLGLARSGWYGVAALLAAIVALHLTLTAKYWAPQSLAIRRSRETAGRKRPWTRLFAIRYYSFTEKLVLVLLFAACITLLGLTRWYESAGERPVALASGTLASPLAREVVSSSPLEGPRADFIEGYAAHVVGEEASAREKYSSAGDYPPALNNLAALSGNDALYQRALELAPGMPEAAFNLGRAPDPSPFHANYRADEPLLAVPGTADFRTAISGSWQSAVAATFSNPWLALSGMEFFSVPQLVWQLILALFLVWVLVTLVWLVIPRPSLARNAPRTGVYHLLALLIPGSGLADEAWGVLLMVPWALLGVDALAQWLGWQRSLGLPLETELWALAAIYVVNLIAFVVEYLSYRRRMRELRRRHPEAVEAYGLA
ncbi:MAG TPA: hypothetical protein VF168_08460 [Trueperaceae bacterium]